MLFLLVILFTVYHFENLLGKPPIVTHEPIIISNQLDNKLGQFTQEEVDWVQRKIKK